MLWVWKGCEKQTWCEVHKCETSPNNNILETSKKYEENPKTVFCNNEQTKLQNNISVNLMSIRFC